MNFQQFLSEHYLAEAAFKIVTKDWERMLDLHVAGKDGKAVAEKIKDKNKAIARYVAGLHIAGQEPRNHGNIFISAFDDFGNIAIKLGATVEEIKDAFEKAEIPASIAEKRAALTSKDKKMNSMSVATFNKKLMAAGFDITYEKHNGHAITLEGKDAMTRNGRLWTIGHKAIITAGDKSYKLAFDVITNEGGGSNTYVIDLNESDRIFLPIEGREYGITKFISEVLEVLEKEVAK